MWGKTLSQLCEKAVKMLSFMELLWSCLTHFQELFGRNPANLLCQDTTHFLRTQCWNLFHEIFIKFYQNVNCYQKLLELWKGLFLFLVICYVKCWYTPLCPCFVSIFSQCGLWWSYVVIVVIYGFVIYVVLVVYSVVQNMEKSYMSRLGYLSYS